jgi:uncharacterized protein
VPLTAEMVLVALVLAAGTLLRTTVGFGDALFAIPLLTLLIGVRTAVPVVLAVSLTIAVAILRATPRSIAPGDVGRLLLGALPGVPVGVVLLRSVPESAMSAVLGVLVAGFGAWRLGRIAGALPDARRFEEADGTTTVKRFAPLAGFFSGALGSATGAGGPPVVVYGMMSGWAPQRFRATLQVFFFCSGALTAAGYAWSGLWTATTVRLYAVALPGVLLALAVGARIARRLSAERFAGVVAALVTVLGVALIIEAVS